MKKIITIIFIVFAAFLISSCENDENKSDYVSTFSLIETGEYMGHCYLLVKKENNGETLSTEPVYDGKLAIDFITAKEYEEGEWKNVLPVILWMVEKTIIQLKLWQREKFPR